MKNKNLSLSNATITLLVLYTTLWVGAFIKGCSTTIDNYSGYTLLSFITWMIPIIGIPSMILQRRFLLLRQIGITIFFLIHIAALIVIPIFLDSEDIMPILMGFVLAVTLSFAGILFTKNNGIRDWCILFPTKQTKEQMNSILQEESIDDTHQIESIEEIQLTIEQNNTNKRKFQINCKTLKNRLIQGWEYCRSIPHFYAKFMLSIAVISIVWMAISLQTIATNISGICYDDWVDEGKYIQTRGSVSVDGDIDAEVSGYIDADIEGDIGAAVRGHVSTW